MYPQTEHSSPVIGTFPIQSRRFIWLEFIAGSCLIRSIFSGFFIIDFSEIKVYIDECFCFFLQSETLMNKGTPPKALQFPNNNK